MMKINIHVKYMLTIFMAGMLYGGKLYEERIYEPVVITGAQAPMLKGLPIDQMFVYAYRNNTWQMIPFQIDERVKLSDPDLTKEENDRSRHFYVIANTNPEYVRPDTNATFDGDDELVFMIRDCGDEGPLDNALIPDAEARSNNKYKLTITDPLLPQNKAYVYIFQSSTITMPETVANKYGMQFDVETHTVHTLAYSVRVSQVDGFLSDIIIKPPYGNGVDIFDTQKFRMNAWLELALGIPLQFGINDANSATEIIFYVFNNDAYLSYKEKPVVRMIREVRESLGNNEDGSSYKDTEFYVKTKFYPFSARFEGGTVLDPDSIQLALADPSVEVYIEVYYLRQSWDFNANASGMKFYNTYNNQISVDGQPDHLNTAVDLPPETSRLQTWSMITGTQGTFFNFFDVAESNWDEVSLYYYDNKNGGQADEDIIIADDTGDDFGSYGDHGLRFVNETYDKPLNLDFSFTGFFIESNQNENMGNKLWNWLRSPVITQSSNFVTDVAAPESNIIPKAFVLHQNFPNPFNQATRFVFTLRKQSQIRLAVVDASGHEVRLLCEGVFPAGEQRVEWNALSDDGSTLASGIYFIRLITPDGQDQKKIVLLK